MVFVTELDSIPMAEVYGGFQITQSIFYLDSKRLLHKPTFRLCPSFKKKLHLLNTPFTANQLPPKLTSTGFYLVTGNQQFSKFTIPVSSFIKNLAFNFSISILFSITFFLFMELLITSFASSAIGTFNWFCFACFLQSVIASYPPPSVCHIYCFHAYPAYKIITFHSLAATSTVLFGFNRYPLCYTQLNFS